MQINQQPALPDVNNVTAASPDANASRRGYMLQKHNVAGLNICTANI